MKQGSLLPRGFKANAERTAIKFRNELDLKSHEPLCGFKLAEHLEIPIYTAPEIFPPEMDITPLVGLTNEDNGWSALTMKTKQSNTIIIHNHLHASTRQQSNLMHELAHIICEHEQPKAYTDIALPSFMRAFDKQQEEEANYLGSALQITREGLIWALKKKMLEKDIAEHFNASLSMVSLRINSTGVKRQLSYLK